ncbi:hypothetical protein HY949_00520 [Candidatus Gottesmanbacteria bacterium]|nr:hypothetical protein [Candidatus Gottesmanbacteria bacterium]
MIEEARASLFTALTETYVLIPDKNLPEAYIKSIEPLLGGVSPEDRLTLARELLQKTTFGEKEYAFAGLAAYLDPSIIGEVLST